MKNLSLYAVQELKANNIVCAGEALQPLLLPRSALESRTFSHSFACAQGVFLAPRTWDVSTAAFSCQEKARMAQYLRQEDAQSFTVSHYLKRHLCAAFCHKSPKDMQFTHNKYGKPCLDSPEPQVHFNISHSGAWCGVALSTRGSVGFDIQSPFVSGDAPLASFLHKDDALRPENAAEKALLWCMKEAALKAMGKGLYTSLASFCVRNATQKGLFTARIQGQSFFIRAWQGQGGYGLAVASESVQPCDFYSII